MEGIQWLSLLESLGGDPSVSSRRSWAATRSWNATKHALGVIMKGFGGKGEDARYACL